VARKERRRGEAKKKMSRRREEGIEGV